jgi:hypothetical protein
MDHGDLRAGHLPGLDYAHLSFVNSYIKSVKKASISFSFGDLDLKSAEYLKLDSKASRIEIKELKKLHMMSTRDRLEIEHLQEGNIMASLSKIEIGKLSQSLDLTLKYGTLRIEHVLSTVELMSLLPSRSTMDFYFDTGCTFTVDGHGEDLDLIYDQGLGNLSSNSTGIRGTIGTAGSSHKIYISGNNSSISFNKN